MDPLRAILAEYVGGAVEAGGPVVIGVIVLPILGAIALLGVPVLGGGILLIWLPLGVVLVSCLLAPSTAVNTGLTLLGRAGGSSGDDGDENSDENTDSSNDNSDSETTDGTG